MLISWVPVRRRQLPIEQQHQILKTGPVVHKLLFSVPVRFFSYLPQGYGVFPP